MNAVTELDSADFPSDVSDEAIGASLQRSRRTALIALGLFAFVALVAGFLVPIAGAVIGQGRLGVESEVKRIAHPTGGVVSEILVRDGDRVRQGQVLVRLDTTVAGTSASLSSRSVDQLLAQEARLQAEGAGLASIAFPPELLSGSESARSAMAAEQRLFALRRTSRAGMRAQLGERVQQLNQQIGGYNVQIGALQKQQKLIAPELKGVRELWSKGLVTINRLNQLERTAVDLDGSIGSLQANISQTRAQIAETREQTISLDQQARSDAATELSQVRAALNEQRVRSVTASAAYDKSAIRAPQDGTVDKLAVATIGGVIQPAETIMELVPDKDGLLVDASISPADIDRVRNGQSARVRLSAFSAGTTPEIPGTLVFISAESATDQKSQQSFYRVKVKLDPAAIRREKLELKPGMPAEVFITTQSRSLLSYLTKPFRDQLARAFND